MTASRFLTQYVRLQQSLRPTVTVTQNSSIWTMGVHNEPLSVVSKGLVQIRNTDLPLLNKLPHAHRIIGMRNIIVHEYGDIDSILVWHAVSTQLAGLIAAVQNEIDGLERNG